LRRSIGLIATSSLGIVLSFAQQSDPNPGDYLRQTQRKLTNSYLPFQVGSHWDYRACEVKDDDGGSKESTAKPCVQFSERVHAAATVDGGVLTQFQRNGIVPEYHFCYFDGGGTETKFWYLSVASGVFLTCTSEETDQLIRDLKDDPNVTVPSHDPQFVFPFKVGATWGDRWEITTKLPVTVPAGTFDDCYEAAFETRLGMQKRWVCKGVGVVAYEYPGETVESHYRVELINFKIEDGPKVPSRPTVNPSQSTLPKN
jgi:hypothetical protein